MLFQQILNGLSIGCTYALIAVGYNLVFGVLRVVNLAYGEIFMAGAFSALLFSSRISPNPPLVVLASVLGAMTTGLIVHTVAVRPLGSISDPNSPRHLSVLVSTIGCSLLLQNLAVTLFGAYPQPFPRLIPQIYLRVSNAEIDSALVINLAFSIAIMGALSFLIRSTRFGLRVRAMAENRELALCSGIRTSRDEWVTVAISSGLAGVAAVLVSQAIGTTSPFVGIQYGFKGLIVIIVGGLGKMRGALAVGLLLGLTEALSVAYISSSYRDAIAFTLLVLFVLGKGVLSGIRKGR